MIVWMRVIIGPLPFRGSIQIRSEGFQLPLRRRRGRGRRHERGRGAGTKLVSAFQYGQAPAALEAFLSNVLLADFEPEDVVVSKAAPMFGDLGGTTKGGGVKVGKNPERDFAREDGEGVYSYEVAELLCEKGELGEATHREYALEDEFPPGVRGGGKVGPD